MVDRDGVVCDSRFVFLCCQCHGFVGALFIGVYSNNSNSNIWWTFNPKKTAAGSKTRTSYFIKIVI